MTYGEQSEDIPIIVAAKNVSSISVKTAPDKTQYIEGEKFDPTGLVITVSYDNGTSAEIKYGENSGITYAPSEALSTTDTKRTGKGLESADG